MKKLNQNGVTLIALTITVIVLLILASVAVYSGMDIIESSKVTTFTAEMKIMQTQVNSLYDQWKSGDINKDEKGKSLDYNTEVQEQTNKVLVTELDITDTTGYRYFDQETIQSLRIEGVKQEFFVNIEKREVVSYKGLKYKGDMYYTLTQLPDGLYNIDYDPSASGEPTFDVSYDKSGENRWTITISNIQYDGNINRWYVKYQLEGEENWQTSENLSFMVDKQGIYTIKLYNGDIETIQGKEVFVATDYAKSGLLLHYDAINNTGEGDNKHSTTATTWKDLSGNGNDGELQNFDTTDESGWKDSYLKFDGVNDTVDTGLPGATTFTSDDNYTLEVAFNMNEVTAQGNQYEEGDTSTILGSIHYCGYGIFWGAGSLDRYTLYVGHRYNNVQTTVQTSKNIELIDDIINNVKQKNTVSQVYNRSNNKILMYLNGVKVGEGDMSTEYSKEYDIAEQMGNIMINDNEAFNGNRNPVYSNMNVYSVRIYDRALTESEAKINQEVDRKRFDLDK